MLIIAPGQEAKKEYPFDILEREGMLCVLIRIASSSPHRGDSTDYTQYINFKIKKKIPINYPKSAAMGVLYS